MPGLCLGPKVALTLVPGSKACALQPNSIPGSDILPGESSPPPPLQLQLSCVLRAAGLLGGAPLPLASPLCYISLQPNTPGVWKGRAFY